MIAIIMFLIFVIAVLGYTYLDNKEKREQEEHYQNFQSTYSTDTTNMTDEEIKKELLNQIRGININLVEIQTQIDKQDKKLAKIKDNVDFITAIMIIPIIIGIIIILLSVYAGGNILKNLNASTENKTRVTVNVTDEAGNIIEDSEYHGQNINNSDLSTYYETDYQGSY